MGVGASSGMRSKDLSQAGNTNASMTKKPCDATAPNAPQTSVAALNPNDAESPIPLGGTSDTTANNLYATLNDIFGPEGSTARYIKRRVIGKGAFGEAHIVECNSLYSPSEHARSEAQFLSNHLSHKTIPKGLYVAKIMDLRGMQQESRCYTQTEIMCLAHTNHFGIIKYYEHFVLDSDDETMVIITELADHGDLNHNLNRGGVKSSTDANAVPSLRLTEREAGTYFVQVLMALYHIHSRRMIHRDIKSANLLLTSRGFIKLGDFGFSQKYESTVSSETIAGTFLGTPYYLSPEMWKATRYGKKADVWAAGVVLYEMLTGGKRPFDGDCLPKLRDVILSKEVALPEAPPTSETAAQEPISAEMWEFLLLMLQKDPSLRLSAEELLRTPIMQHYLAVFEKHVQMLFDQDDAALAANPGTERLALNFPDDADRALVLQGISDAKAAIEKEIQKDINGSAAPRYEGVIYKDSHNGVWKERYLSLEDNVLTISLAKGKEAVGGGERSKKVPLNMVKSVNPCEVETAHVRVSAAAVHSTHAFGNPAVSATEAMSSGAPAAGGAKGQFKPPYAFAIAMESSNSIVFGVADSQELDNWMSTLMRALNID